VASWSEVKQRVRAYLGDADARSGLSEPCDRPEPRFLLFLPAGLIWGALMGAVMPTLEGGWSWTAFALWIVIGGQIFALGTFALAHRAWRRREPQAPT
jgi:hypothetical protein